MTKNMTAFLSMIARSEGTSIIPGSDDGYRVIVGGTLMETYTDHPRKLVKLNKAGLQSTAAGRYQMLDDLRDFFIHPMTVNNWHSGGQFQFRGYRPPTYKPGVTPGSYHRMGMAFDFDVKDHTATEARKLIIGSAKVNNPLTMKVQRMEDNVTWLHCDTGKVPEGQPRPYLFRA